MHVVAALGIAPADEPIAWRGLRSHEEQWPVVQKIHQHPLAPQHAPADLKSIREELDGNLPNVHLPELMMAVDGEIRFSRILLGREPANEQELLYVYMGLLAHVMDATARRMSLMTPGLSVSGLISALQLLEDGPTIARYETSAKAANVEPEPNTLYYVMKQLFTRPHDFPDALDFMITKATDALQIARSFLLATVTVLVSLYAAAVSAGGGGNSAALDPKSGSEAPAPAVSTNSVAETNLACSLVSTADAEAVLGEAVSKPQSESRSTATVQSSSCRFLAAQTNAKYLSVMVQITPNSGFNPTAMFDQLSNAFGPSNAQQISGVGDQAEWRSMPIQGQQLTLFSARKGTMWVVLFIRGLPDDADTINRAKVLAGKLFSKV